MKYPTHIQTMTTAIRITFLEKMMTTTTMVMMMMMVEAGTKT